MREQWLQRIICGWTFLPLLPTAAGHGRHHADHVGAGGLQRGLGRALDQTRPALIHAVREAKYRATSCRQLQLQPVGQELLLRRRSGGEFFLLPQTRAELR